MGDKRRVGPHPGIQTIEVGGLRDQVRFIDVECGVSKVAAVEIYLFRLLQQFEKIVDSPGRRRRSVE
jgi:hypothetical protein